MTRWRRVLAKRTVVLVRFCRPVRYIEFIYDATGKKWRKTAKEAGKADIVRDYIGEAEYLNTQQDIIHFSEGYAKRDISTDGDGVWNGWVYKYTLKDHLGNTRVTYCDINKDGIVNTSTIEQVNHYHAFGLNMEGPWAGADGAYKNQYNGKEWNDDFGLGWNDYGARFYDAVIGRFPTVDLLSEIYDFQSPYVYAANNPINFIDFMGLAPSKEDPNYDPDKDKTLHEGVTVTAKRPAAKVNHSAWVNSFDATMGVTPNQWNNPFKGSHKYESDQRYYTEVLPELFEDVVEVEAEIIEFAFTLGFSSAYKPGKYVFKQGVKRQARKAKRISKLIPLGLGSPTGRTIAKNLIEQMAMKNILSNPKLGKVVMEGMSDSRWVGWSKMQYTETSQNGVKAVIHYVGKFENGVLKAVDDFKFK